MYKTLCKAGFYHEKQNFIFHNKDTFMNFFQIKAGK